MIVKPIKKGGVQNRTGKLGVAKPHQSTAKGDLECGRVEALMGTPKPRLTGSFRIEIQTAALEGVWSSKTRPPSPVYLKELCTRRDLPSTFDKAVKSRLLILWTGETSSRVTCREDVLNMVRRLGLRLGILAKALGKEVADSLWAQNAPREGSRRDQRRALMRYVTSRASEGEEALRSTEEDLQEHLVGEEELLRTDISMAKEELLGAARRCWAPHRAPHRAPVDNACISRLLAQ